MRTHVVTNGSWLQLGMVLSIVLLLTLTGQAQGPLPVGSVEVEPYYSFPASDTAALVSFDWDHEGNLHYSVRDPNWGLKLEVYKHAEDRDIPVFLSESVWAGSRLTRIGSRMYFNDGGDYMRSDFDYFMYYSDAPETVAPLLASPYGASLWGVTARDDTTFFASGTEIAWGPAALFFSPLNRSGLLEEVPPRVIGEIGDSPGPMTFDAEGNLYYAPGYVFSGTAHIYRWSAAEVAAALLATSGPGLTPEERVWSTLPAPYDGATGLATDDAGNVYASATAWGSPSQLIVFPVDTPTPIVLAQYSGRLETVRHRDNAVYVSCTDGVFRLPLLAVEPSSGATSIVVAPGETAVFAVNVQGGIGEKRYQWFRLDANKSATPIGDDLAHYAFTASLEDNGTTFFCVVDDDIVSVESPHFTLTVQPPVPLTGDLAMALFALILFTLGAASLYIRADARSTH